MHMYAKNKIALLGVQNNMYIILSQKILGNTSTGIQEAQS